MNKNNVVSAIVMLIASVFLIGSNYANTVKRETKKSDNFILLTKNNFVLLNGEIDKKLAQSVIEELIRQDGNLKKESDILYLVLDTVGGDVRAGDAIVVTCRDLKHKVETISIEASSTGFFIVEALGERLVLKNGRMVTHQPTIYVAGQYQKEFFKNLIDQLTYITMVEAMAAYRMKISLLKYRELIENGNFERFGQSAVIANMADRVVDVKCENDVAECPIK